MRQIRPRANWSGCKGCDWFEGSDLACDAWGEMANTSGLVAFSYLWRRFGPPASSNDEYKSIADYVLSTKIDGLGLWITCSPSRLSLCVGVLWSREIAERLAEPAQKWSAEAERVFIDRYYPNHTGEFTEEDCEKFFNWKWHEASKAIGPHPRWNPHKWQQQSGLIHDLNQALFDSLKELERPVCVRGDAFNIFGQEAMPKMKPAKPSRLAGYGINHKPLISQWKKDQEKRGDSCT